MADFAINWAISLSQLDIHNWIIICRDNACFKHLHLHYGDHIVKGPTMNNMISTTASAFNSEGFGALVKKRSFFVREILQQGYTALYSDVDMIWQKNPLPFLPGDKDLVVQNDVRKTDQSLNLCTCFFAIRPTRNSLRLLDVWEEEMKAENKNQAGFNRAAKRLQEAAPTDQEEKAMLLLADNMRHEQKRLRSSIVWGRRGLDGIIPGAIDQSGVRWQDDKREKYKELSRTIAHRHHFSLGRMGARGGNML
ncbi:unnamed protein product [Vitrella brassicaformis CCMP3155]|uniref:Nucleotide-diphospho-sugar transferase domain-containing protein n=1 Tax=Vitrella brassicaformis (strain CCMP3155) TaxID=1169540 RepID=A0A0G4EJG3_VITBC|nr:unnamed protein product [Vitrella brassicaformis CCMP3155]|eukprot:CEL97123.1 unnamed protein product [Vitrella brassicaformis CCMP3155]